MKKFYSVIAAAAVGSLISASAFTTVERAEKQLREDLPNVELGKIQQAKKTMRSLAGVSSRADEGYVDLTTFTQGIFYDYFDNWQEPVPGAIRGSENEFVETEAFRNILTCVPTEIVDNNDGSLSIVGFNGYNMNVFLHVNASGDLVADAGQTLLENGGWTFVLAAINNDGEIAVSGEIPFSVYQNAIIPDCMGLGAYAINPSTGQGGGWGFLSMNCGYYAPNATLSYPVEMNDGTVTEVNNRVLVQFLNADPNADQTSVESFERLLVSSVNPDDYGFAVQFAIVGDFITTINAPAAPYAYAYNEYNQVVNTGDFYMSYFFTDAGQTYYDPNYVCAETPSETQISWPVVGEGLTAPEISGQWSVVSDLGFLMYMAEKATLTLDSDNGETGITDIISGNDAPAVYYNLQGVQVANPTAGQIYIVKNGNKVSKQIIK